MHPFASAPRLFNYSPSTMASAEIKGKQILCEDEYVCFDKLDEGCAGAVKLDRFIPNRSAMDFDYAHYILTNGCKKENPVSCSPAKEAYIQQLKEVFGMNRTRILAFKNKPPPTRAESTTPWELSTSHQQQFPPLTNNIRTK